MATLTVITAKRPALLSKRICRTPEGQLSKAGGGVLVEGTATVRKITGLDDLAELLADLGPDQALTYGVPRAGDSRLLSRREWERAGRPDDTVTRTRQHFAWPAGSGVMMIDHDPDGTAETLTRDQLVDLLRAPAPGLATAAMLWQPSASSHVFDAKTGEDLTGLRGQRLYLLVVDASDIPRAGAALIDRLWADGHGRIVASTAGAALERCPVDASVWQPERLDFAAGAVCGPGLVQHRGAPQRIAGDIEVVGTRDALPDDVEVFRAAGFAGGAAREAARSVLDAARNAFVARTADEMLPPADRGDTGKRSDAEAIARRAVEHRVLAGDYPVEIETAPGAFERVTVGRILDDRHRYHGQLTRDPLEPSYDGGRSKGKLFLLDGRPTLHSFAHGGRTVRLIRAPFRIELKAGRTAEATDAALEKLREDPGIYDHGGQLVLVANGRVHPLDEPALAHHLAGITQFWRAKRVGGRGDSDQVAVEVDVDPPAALVRQVLSPALVRGLKPLSAVISAPTLRPDGSVLDRSGYDLETGLFVDPGGADMPPIPENPDAIAARVALDRVMRPFEDIPFVDAFARGAFLAALLTAVLRPALPTAPAFAFDAPVQGSGKTLLASCVAVLATGRPPEIWPHVAGRDDEEIRKRLFAALRGASGALVWDNVTGVLDSAALAAVLTVPVLTDRVLGRSETQSIPNRALVLITGNNVTLAGDLVRRAIPVRIDPGTDLPFARAFSVNPLQHVRAERPRLAADALILARAALATGFRPAAGRVIAFREGRIVDGLRIVSRPARNGKEFRVERAVLPSTVSDSIGGAT